ncbi:hypothetical protein K4F52_007759 [Lecanicillium sp. MT-2017a]|nr:hypothetical protein K4F52_007759 [Lecanicillium sp. MT-2017a]
MVVTATKTTPAPTLRTDLGSNCPGCGCDLPPSSPLDKSQAELATAQARIAELEREVRILNQRASAAAGRWAEYEAELAKLRGQQPTSPQTPTSSRGDPLASANQTPTRSGSILQQSTERISNLLYSRKSSPNLRAGASQPPTIRTGSSISSTSGNTMLSPTRRSASPPLPGTPTGMAENLLEALSLEQNLRQQAEGRLSATSKEMEELSAALFEQANEMVADERRARAKLEERVGELEKRDVEKKKRLDRLESAMNRVERVKNLLSDN